MSKRVKTVVVTGATGGLGKTLLAVIGAEGHRAISVQRQPGPDACTIVTDLANAATASADVRRGLNRLAPQGVDVFINNAGLGHLAPIAATSTEDARRIMEVNFITPAALTRVVWPLLELKCGTVLNIGSIASRITVPTVGVYAASKRALLALTDATRLEGRPFQIQAGYVELGNVATGLHSRVTRELSERLDDSALSSWSPLRRMMERSLTFAETLGSQAMPSLEAAERIWRIESLGIVPRITTVGRDAWHRRLIAALVPHAVIEWRLSNLFR